MNIYFFHSNTCPHCKSEEKFLSKLEKNYHYIHVYRYEVHDVKNQEYIKLLEEEYNFSLTSVPVTVIGSEIIFGYQDEESNLEMMRDISYFSSYYYEDRLGDKLGIESLQTYQANQNDPSLEEYLNSIDDKIFGFLSVRNLDHYTTASILGFVGGLNIYYLFSLIFLFFFIKKYLRLRDGMFILFFYFLFLFILEFSLFKGTQFIYLPILFLELILFFFLAFKKKKFSFSFNLIPIIFSFLVIYFKRGNQNLVVFQNIDRIYQLVGGEQILYYGCYFFSLFLVYCFSFCLFFLILDRISMEGEKKIG